MQATRKDRISAVLLITANFALGLVSFITPIALPAAVYFLLRNKLLPITRNTALRLVDFYLSLLIWYAVTLALIFVGAIALRDADISLSQLMNAYPLNTLLIMVSIAGYLISTQVLWLINTLRGQDYRPFILISFCESIRDRKLRRAQKLPSPNTSTTEPA
ncbi:hypothetical protein [Atopomonas hussainii]|uniref:hypothetical protein n=1 Tax=Atopomonas hussainii TaxID=1429083 RepID=UPI0009003839|nr:hypothetical protein [Atopomonas hussainii]